MHCYSPQSFRESDTTEQLSVLPHMLHWDKFKIDKIFLKIKT